MGFDANKHIFTSPQIETVISGAVDFIEHTPAYPLPPPESFKGTGVYCLYYLGKFDLYNKIACKNEKECTTAIYVGKAVPTGWRTAREKMKEDSKLYGRLREHRNSIRKGTGLDENDFKCRFIILNDEASSMITILEATLIKKYKPLWNTFVDGFGNHDPGKGRYDQAKSEWDVLHPGRAWAEKLKGQPPDINNIKAKIKAYKS